MISGHTLFKYNISVKLHFMTELYNVFEYNGKVKHTSYEEFLAKRDFNSFNSLARKFETDAEAIHFLVANYAYKNINPVHNISSGDNNYVTWTKRKQSITNIFLTDIDKIILLMEKGDLKYSDIVSCDDGMPKLFKLYLGNIITIETLHIINEIEPFIHDWKSKMLSVWEKDLLIIVKLKKFVKFDMEKVKKIYSTMG